MTELGWRRKDLLGIAELSVSEIETILDTAKSFAEVARRPVKKVPTLRGKTVVNLFFEPSTRTRVSFEIAAQRLSADVVNFATVGSSRWWWGRRCRRRATATSSRSAIALRVRGRGMTVTCRPARRRRTSRRCISRR